MATTWNMDIEVFFPLGEGILQCSTCVDYLVLCVEGNDKCECKSLDSPNGEELKSNQKCTREQKKKIFVA